MDALRAFPDRPDLRELYIKFELGTATAEEKIRLHGEFQRLSERKEEKIFEVSKIGNLKSWERIELEIPPRPPATIKPSPEIKELLKRWPKKLQDK